MMEEMRIQSDCKFTIELNQNIIAVSPLRGTMAGYSAAIEPFHPLTK